MTRRAGDPPPSRRSVLAEQAPKVGPGLVLPAGRCRIGLRGIAPVAHPEVEVFAEIGRVLLGHGLRPPLPALVGCLKVVEPAVEADPQVGPALRAAFTATRSIAEGPQPAAPMTMTRHASSIYQPSSHDGRPELARNGPSNRSTFHKPLPGSILPRVRRPRTRPTLNHLQPLQGDDRARQTATAATGPTSTDRAAIKAVGPARTIPARSRRHEDASGTRP